jgi:hypothetical protein
MRVDAGEPTRTFVMRSSRRWMRARISKREIRSTDQTCRANRDSSAA